MSAKRFDLLGRLERERVVAVLRRVRNVDRVGVGSSLSNADDLALEARRLVEATQRVE